MNPPGRRVIVRIALRAAAAAAIAALAGVSRLAPGARLTDGTRWTLLAIAIAIGLGWVLTELLKLGLERLVGFRYLHRGRRSRWATIGLVAGLGLVVVGAVVFAIAHPQHRHRVFETAGVVGVLVGGLV